MVKSRYDFIVIGGDSGGDSGGCAVAAGLCGLMAANFGSRVHRLCLQLRLQIQMHLQ